MHFVGQREFVKHIYCALFGRIVIRYDIAVRNGRFPVFRNNVRCDVGACVRDEIVKIIPLNKVPVRFKCSLVYRRLEKIPDGNHTACDAFNQFHVFHVGTTLVEFWGALDKIKLIQALQFKVSVTFWIECRNVHNVSVSLENGLCIRSVNGFPHSDASKIVKIFKTIHFIRHIPAYNIVFIRKNHFLETIHVSGLTWKNRVFVFNEPHFPYLMITIFEHVSDRFFINFGKSIRHNHKRSCFFAEHCPYNAVACLRYIKIKAVHLSSSFL